MRALLLVLDSVGAGAAPDAGAYGDEGSDTLGHLLQRQPDLKLPNLWSLGLGQILNHNPCAHPQASFGRMRECSAGKDSTTGHWELAGAVLARPFAVFDHFPTELVSAIEAESGIRFIGNIPASGTQIIEQLGPEHIRLGRPILYTSADSVLQIAAHQDVIPVDRLYEICRTARKHADAYRIGRVIARPFIGTSGNFQRTSLRHDFSMLPPRTVLDSLQQASWPVKAIGKTVDLFAGQGISEAHPTVSNLEGMQKTQEIWRDTDDGLLFVNLVDFDTMYGHRRDVAGYARALEEFDQWLGGFLPACGDEDLLVITADHGNDPTFKGTDHTREEVPVMVRHAQQHQDLGCSSSFTDVAATLARFFELEERWIVGRPLINDCC